MYCLADWSNVPLPDSEEDEPDEWPCWEDALAQWESQRSGCCTADEPPWPPWPEVADESPSQDVMVLVRFLSEAVDTQRAMRTILHEDSGVCPKSARLAIAIHSQNCSAPVVSDDWRTQYAEVVATQQSADHLAHS
uniref:Uncharacterized protein n=1 Tax=Noctiluca scintillans TaxID=2966 RepID=A0A7S0ZUQ1_NOCSC